MADDLLRIYIFLGCLVVFVVLEALWPRRLRTQTRTQRWSTNAIILLTEIIVLRLLGPISALTTAYYTMQHGWGLLSLLAMPFYLDVVISFILLDVAIYWQHVASHKIPFLWRFHRIHHSDRDLDVTSGFRFHPIEAGLSMLYKCFIILLFGPIITAVIIFEIMLNASAMFNHANIKLPARLDALLRLAIVTPDFHRTHHSTMQQETNSNYGFFLPWWDYIFSSYTKEPALGHEHMTIGLQEYQDTQPSKWLWCLTNPFTKKPNE